MPKIKLLMLAILVTIFSFTLPQISFAQTYQVDDYVSVVRKGWEIVKYQITDKEHQLSEMAKLENNAAQVSAAFPNEASPKVWEGIIASTHAGIIGGLSALPKVKKAKKLFEAALAIDPRSENGAAHTSLGSLYYQVPPWPIAFGSNKKALKHLKAGLEIAPMDIDANFFYADFLMTEKKYTEAIQYLEMAMQAPSRPGREIGDVGRRTEIQELLKKAHEKAKHQGSNNKSGYN